jgi:hypothetical protein
MGYAGQWWNINESAIEIRSDYVGDFVAAIGFNC